MNVPTEGLDLFSAVSAAARGVARSLRADGVSAVLLWGDPPEAEVVYRQGMPETVCRALGTAGGRALAAALRREGRPLLVEGDALEDEAPEMVTSMGMHGIAALAAFPLYAEPGIVGCMVVPVDQGTVLDDARRDWKVACQSLAALQLAAAVAALRALLTEDRRQPAGWADGILVYDPWERVLFADGFFREFPGWNREDPFGRALGMLPGGVLLTNMKPSHPGHLVWEEHLLPPVAGHGVPVALASLPLDIDRTGSPNARLVLVRDLRPDDQRGPDPSTRLLALGMRVAHASDELLQAVSEPVDPADASGSPSALRRGRIVAEEAPGVVRAVLDRVGTETEGRLVDLTRVAEDILARFGDALEAERIRVFRFFAPDLPGIPGDPLKIARAVRTLVRVGRASLRPGGGTLTVRTWRQDDFVWLAVSDDGSGARAAKEGFRALFPGEDDPTQELAAVGRLAEAMGGRLLTESHQRLWNRLTLTLPVERRSGAGRGAPVDGVDRRRKEEPAEEGLRVLVVDDNAALRSVLKRFLERRGHVVTEAEDGEVALGMVQGQGFDRVILDVNMPGRTGPELYACLEEVAPTMCDRTIFMTGGSLEGDTERFLEDSGRPAIQKPFDLAEMARTVEGG